MRLISYGRVSTDEQAFYGTGLETQRLDCDAYAVNMGAVIVGHEEDPGVSGTIYPRAGLERAMSRIQRGEAHGLIVHRVDRLGRKMYIPPTVYEHLLQCGARLLTVQDGEVTEGNILLFCLRCGMAQADHTNIVNNLAGGKRRQAESGLTPSRAKSPFGYHIVQKIEGGIVQEKPGTYRIVEEQAKIVRQIFALYAAGLSLDAICLLLQQQGTPPPGKTKKRAVGIWLRSTINRIIDNPAYKGDAVWGRTKRINKNRAHLPPNDPGRLHSSEGLYRSNVVQPDSARVLIPVPPIVDAALWEQCQQRRRENKANTQRHDRKHLLSGLLFCPVCGLRLIIQSPKGKGRHHYYKCPGNKAQQEQETDVAHAKAHYPEPDIVQALVKMLEQIKTDSGFAATAYAAHTQESGSADVAAELVAAKKRLEDLHEKEEATVKAQIRAVQTQTRLEIYDDLLTDISQERRKLEQRVTQLALASIQLQRHAPIDVAGAADLVATAMLTVLQLEHISRGEKNTALRGSIQSITPTEGGYKVAMRPFLEGEQKRTAQDGRGHPARCFVPF